MPLATHMNFVSGNMCTKFLHTDEHDNDDEEHNDDAKAMTIATFVFLRKTDELKTLSKVNF